MPSAFSARIRVCILRAIALCGGLLLLGSNAVMAQGLTLPDILVRVAKADPSLQVNTARRNAADATIRQAEFGPRPRLGLDLEDFGGSGPYAINRSQATVFYEETWERGGKRQARVDVARAERSIADQRATIRLLDSLEKAQAAWVEALVADAAVEVARDRVAVAERIEQETSRRVGRALDPVFAGERARTALAQARIALDQAIEQSRIVRTSLASFWGGTSAEALDGHSFTQMQPSTVRGDEAPDLNLFTAQREAASAAMQLAQTNGVTDPTWRAGVRHFGQGNEFAFVVGASIPLGVEAASRPALERAQAERAAVEGELAVARLQFVREADRLRAEQAALVSEARRLETEVIPLAERAANLATEGFNRGGTAFTFLEVAEAQRSVIEARTRRVDLLRRFHLASVRLDRIAGRHLSLIGSEEKR